MEDWIEPAASVTDTDLMSGGFWLSHWPILLLGLSLSLSLILLLPSLQGRLSRRRQRWLLAAAGALLFTGGGACGHRVISASYWYPPAIFDAAGLPLAGAWALTGLLGVALLGAGAALCCAPARRCGRALGRLLLLSAGSLAAALPAGAALIAAARAPLFEALAVPPGTVPKVDLSCLTAGVAAVTQVNVAFLIGGTILIVIPLGALAGAIHVLRRAPATEPAAPSPRALPPYLPVLMLVWLFGVGLLAYEGESYLGCGSIPGLIRAAHFQAEILRGFPVLICTAAIVATLLSRWAAVAQGGRGSTPGRLQLCLSGLVFAAGLLAYGLTRGHSYDAQHRLPWPEVPRFYTGRIAVPVTASDAGCAEDPEQLEVLLEEQHITLHGSPTDTTELPELLARHAQLWRTFHPDKVLDFRPVIVARDDERVSGRLTAVLQAVSQVKDVAPVVVVLLQRPAQLRTKTLGPLSYPLRCYRQLTFAPTGRPLASFATWGDLGRAAPAVGALPVALPRRAGPATGSSSTKSSGG